MTTRPTAPRTESRQVATPTEPVGRGTSSSGAPCRNFFTDPASADAAIKRVLAENNATNYELTVRAQNGEETVVSYNAATFHDRDRRLRGVFASAWDVTDRKQVKRTLLEKNIELVRASR